MASKAIGFLNFKFSADLSGFERAMNKAQKKLKKFGKNIQKTGKSLTMGLTVPILGMAAAALKFGSDLQETDSKFKQVFSSIKKEAEDTAKVFQESFGLSELASKQLLSDTGDLLVGFGFTEKSALDLSKQVNELAVDLASFTNYEGGAEGASKALTKALVGETESAKSLGIVIRQGTKEYKDRTTAIMNEQGVSILQAKALNNLEIATAQSQKAIGDFERTSGDFANQLRIVKGDLVDIAAEMGARLIPYAQAAIEKFKVLMSFFDGLSSSTKDTIVFWGLILAAIGPVLIVIGKMSVGISALIPLVKTLTATLSANPWLVLAAAIALVALAVYDYTTTLHGAEKAKRDLLDIELDAVANAKNEERLLLQKLEVARDVTKSDKERQGAIVELNNKLVGLNKTLNLENIAEVKVTNAINEHTEALINQAKIVGIQELITANFKEMQKVALDGSRAMGDMVSIQGLLDVGKHFTTTLGGILSGEGISESSKKGGKAIVDGYVDGLKEEESILQTALNELLDITPSLPGLTPDLVDPGKIIDPDDPDGKSAFSINLERLESDSKEASLILKRSYSWNNITKEEFLEKQKKAEGSHLNALKTLYEIYEKDTSDIDNKILDHKIKNQEQQYSLAEDQFKGLIQWTTELTEAQKLLNAGAGIFGDVLSSSLKSALDSQESFFTIFIRNIKKAIASLLIELAIMTMIDILLGGKNFSKALIEGNAMKVMGFAEGGLITGPTLGLIGEGVGTTASNPEVVAPLDKLKSMIGGGGNQHITVTGKLIGNDIFLSNAKTGVDRLRTV